MAFKPLPEEEDEGQGTVISDINLTPLIDIMLVLLIIFMVTSSVSLESGLDIDLPGTASQTREQEGSVVIVSLGGDGKIFLQGRAILRDDLEGGLKEAMEQESTQMVILEGDRTSTLETAIEVMDIAKRAGAEKFAIAAEEK